MSFNSPIVAEFTFLYPDVFAIPWLNFISIPRFLASCTTPASDDFLVSKIVVCIPLALNSMAVS